MTVLDKAYEEMMVDEESASARLAFYSAFRSVELFVLLEAEARADKVDLLVMDTEDAKVALAFDTEARMADFVDRPTPYLGISGRRLTEMLHCKGVALGLNLGVAPSEMLLGTDAIDWVAENAPSAVTVTEATPMEVFRPSVPSAVLEALDAGLARLTGAAVAAWLAGVKYSDGHTATLLAITGVSETDRPAVADAIAEALHFSGLDAAGLDVAFPDERSMGTRIEAVGLRFDIPELPRPAFRGPDPDSPPKLR